MAEKANGIIQMMEVYTAQIEKYETLSTWYSAFCIACALAIAFMAIFLIMRQGKESVSPKEEYNVILSILFLLVPPLMTLYLYTFAMNMRKVALYRGYLTFLEQQWNALTGSGLMLFDADIIKRFYSSNVFWVNGLGPVVMAFFVIIFFFGGFGLAAYYSKRVSTVFPKLGKAIKISLCILGLVCVIFDGICVYYLSSNEQVMESVADYCEERGQ